MITIKEITYVKDNISKNYNKKIHVCPFCENAVVFFDISPLTCYFCRDILVNAGKILSSKDYRIDYHFGKT